MTYATQPAAARTRGAARGRDRHPSDMSNYLVPPAMLVAAVAMGVASNLHLGLATDMAIGVGAAMFCAMLLCHVLLRAADMADRAEEEAEERRIAKVDSPMPMPVREPEPVVEPLAPPQHPAEAAEFGRGLGAMAGQDIQSVVVEPPAVPVAVAVVFDTPPAVAASGGSVDAAPYLSRLPVGLSPPMERELPGQRINPSAWTFRPVDLRGPADDMPARGSDIGAATDAHVMAAAIGALRPTLDDRPIGAPVAVQSGSGEADRIDNILKRLAQQINAGSLHGDPSVEQVGAASAALAVSPEGQTDADALADIAALKPDAALSSAVDALRSTVEAMRPSSAQVPSVVAPVSAVEAEIAAVAEALAVERVDVVLAPILAIAGAEARHFEVSVRLRDAAGGMLDARATAGGARLLPLLDAIHVRHAAGFALKLERRGRDGAVFSEVAGVSLESESFVGDVTGRYAQGIADRMVLTFAQNELRGLGPAHFAALGDLARLGFRFAVTGVADLDMDFETLRNLGFQFVKFDAAVFLLGLPCAGDMVPASDLCRHFSDTGIEVIVSGIDDQTRRDTLMGCGVVLGQGLLYGEPRPIPYAGSAVAAA